MLRLLRTSADRDHGLWSVLALLSVVVLVPTVCLLWFMSAAMQNERLAVREKLAEAYRAHLAGLEARLEMHWQERLRTIETQPAATAAERFAFLVRGGLADAVIFGQSNSGPGYPDSTPVQEPPAGDAGAAWRAAEQLERSNRDLEAAAAYRVIAERSPTIDLAARALQAASRCQARGGAKRDALKILTEELGQPRYRLAADGRGRLIAPSAQLLALEMIGDASRPEFRRTADRLRSWLSDYSLPLPSVQRRFLMRQLLDLDPGAEAPDTLAAEELAARYLDSGAARTPDLVRLSGELRDVWQLASADGTVTALFREGTLLEQMQAVLARQELPADTTIELLPPGGVSQRVPFARLQARGRLDGWTLAQHLERSNLFDDAAERQIAAYGWTGALAILLILVVAGMIVRLVRRQLRLTRMKNDLLATVSHELKTPLASMRLLVDTLLEGGEEDRQQVHEYLRLIAQENVRLSRLVDNFLTFSRMERNKQKFERAEIAPDELAREAAASVGERFAAPGCRFELSIAAPLPPILADRDAILTVLLNLLDNAYKYSEEQRHIVLTTYAENGSVCFAVKDDGIGLSVRAARRVFERFYQVDQRLSRRAGGCGLGLSIVQFIVQAHNGSVAVDSQPGKGSTFTVRLPATQPARRPSA